VLPDDYDVSRHRAEKDGRGPACLDQSVVDAHTFACIVRLFYPRFVRMGMSVADRCRADADQAMEGRLRGRIKQVREWNVRPS